MSSECNVISDKRTLLARYNSLKRGDIVRGRIPLRPGEEHLLLDLANRGIHLVPSAASQLASRSKAFQTLLFQQWMVPGTAVIYGLNHLLEQVSEFNRLSIGKVVFKQDRKNAGLGILLFNSVEEVYTQAANNHLSYPFVIQPFVEQSIDLRVIILEDYIEAYQRENPHNFRNNLHCGGVSKPYPLCKESLDLCRLVMKRGDFPYCHLDLMITMEKKVYLAEVNLRGGIHGAAIGTAEYKKKVAAIEDTAISELLSKG